MELKMKMPDLSTTEGSEVAIVKWLVGEGQAVKRGEAILEVETDKAVQEIEALANGVLKAQLVKPGDKVVTGTLIAMIEVNK
jgi:pyruvate/2-oxoglutarate dehydrogenase complex dihydrolipoamide acyltransferase (E2) component